MFADTKAYSGIAVKDLKEAREFYGGTLGIKTSEEYGLMWLHLAGNRDTLVYVQEDATPASFTILNFEVDDIDEAVDALTEQGVGFERYDGLDQDDKGVFREEGPLHRLVQGSVRQRAIGTTRALNVPAETDHGA
jgi:catechol 2,3-dioxygenase-like lactoylglutathione lyase family enzyme